ncbi:MAG TPA: sulfatase-like hydrolase/transferase [Acidimicrobiales bacterium]|nr:sulfatase-like hydrolase/transferase [Acidimicrobiales bacterium]
MGRKILFITTDQQRYDTVGANGGTLSRTPVLDRLAAEGIRYERCQPTSVVCMPSRASMLTGQFPSTHGAWMNGVALAIDAPSVAENLKDAGYATALIGKAHFEPFMDVFGRFAENSLASLGVPTVEQPWFDGRRGVHRGFDYLEFATHGVMGPLHYAKWIGAQHPEVVKNFYEVVDHDYNVNAAGGGDTGAPQVKFNDVPREWYHTDWVADRTIAWLDAQSDDRDWFCWMSFPDPHHPWDPPISEIGRVPWREVPLPANYPTTASQREAILDDKARHWRAWYDGRLVSNYEAPAKWIPAKMTADQVREVNALNAVEVELIDEAIGRVLRTIDHRGWHDDVDVIFTTDHGEFQGDFGLLFKGPYHVDSLLRLPLIWRPAPSTATVPSVVSAPVSLVSLAATFLQVAGQPTPAWVEGAALPVDDADAMNRSFDATATEWDSVLFGVDVHVRTVVTKKHLYTEYRPGTMHTGTEGELYDLDDDPLQRINRFDDPAYASVKAELAERLAAHERRPGERAAPGVLTAPV